MFRASLFPLQEEYLPLLLPCHRWNTPPSYRRFNLSGPSEDTRIFARRIRPFSRLPLKKDRSTWRGGVKYGSPPLEKLAERRRLDQGLRRYMSREWAHPPSENARFRRWQGPIAVVRGEVERSTYGTARAAASASAGSAPHTPRKPGPGAGLRLSQRRVSLASCRAGGDGCLTPLALALIPAHGPEEGVRTEKRREENEAGRWGRADFRSTPVRGQRMSTEERMSWPKLQARETASRLTIFHGGGPAILA